MLPTERRIECTNRTPEKVRQEARGAEDLVKNLHHPDGREQQVVLAGGHANRHLGGSSPTSTIGLFETAVGSGPTNHY